MQSRKNGTDEKEKNCNEELCNEEQPRDQFPEGCQSRETVD